MVFDPFFTETTRFIVTELEGGYSNVSWDPGGETIFGLCERYHSEEVEQLKSYLRLIDSDLSKACDVFIDSLKSPEVFAKEAILFGKYFTEIFAILCKTYYRHYYLSFAPLVYTAIRKNKFAIAPLLFAYDSSINQGKPVAETILQRVMKQFYTPQIKVDGIFGMKSKALYISEIIENPNFKDDWRHFLVSMIVERLHEYSKIHSDVAAHAKRGWFNRVRKISIFIFNLIESMEVSVDIWKEVV